MTTWRNQRGDTLVEVILALAMLSFIVVSSLTLSLRAYRQGQEAKERTVISNLMQEQAEGLRSLRDRETWRNPGFASNGPPTGVGTHVATGGPFHMEKNAAGKWVVRDGAVVLNSQFNFNITAFKYSHPGDVVNGDNLYQFDLKADWPSSTPGVNNTANFSYLLGNLDGLKPYDCSNLGPGSATGQPTCH